MISINNYRKLELKISLISPFLIYHCCNLKYVESISLFHSKGRAGGPWGPLLDVRSFSHLLRKDCWFLCLYLAISSGGIWMHGCGVCGALPHSMVAGHALRGPSPPLSPPPATPVRAPVEAARVLLAEASPRHFLLQHTHLHAPWDKAQGTMDLFWNFLFLPTITSWHK